MKRVIVKSGKKGQSMVEMAIIAPILLLIIMGIVDFGIIFNNYTVISNATREAARNGVVGATDEEMRTIISNTTPTLTSNKMTITITPAQAYRIKGSALTVKIEYEIIPITPLMAPILPDPFKIASTTVMRME